MFELKESAIVKRDSGPVSPGLPAVLFNSIPLGVFSVDKDLRITTANDAALGSVGISRRRAVGKPCCDVFRISACKEGCFLRQVMQSGEPVINLRAKIRSRAGAQLPVSLSAAVVRDRYGNLEGAVVTLTDLRKEKPLDNRTDRPGPLVDIVTSDPNMRHLFEVLPTISSSDTSVLITGETGTGKNLLAKAIHRLSPRSSGPFVTVNCAALPDTLLESELFGYKAGAFTGAVRDKPGRFAAAQGGTLFLDEIGDIPLATQVKLLRVLQEKVFERLGDHAPIPCDIRIVAATHRNLEEMVDRGSYRRDLYYRINVLNLEIPPLRNRKGDIPLLAQKFVDKFSRSGKKHVTGVTSPAMEVLMRHNYPGNIRELENIIEHAWVMCKDHMVGVEHLPRSLQLLAGGEAPHQTVGLPQVEGAFILQILERNDWHRENAARELGIHRTTLQRKIRKLGLVAPQMDGRFRH